MILMKDNGAREDRKVKTGFSLNLDILCVCLVCAVLLDIIGLFKGLGFDPSFQLEAQPFFFAGVAAAIFLTIVRARLGPILAGVIFWIPIVALLIDLLLVRDLVPFGGDVVGIAELIAAVVGVIAAHNTYHKLKK